jgi:hypothetical protein
MRSRIHPKYKTKAIFGGEGWLEVWARHPDANGHLQTEARFATEV